MDLGAPLNTNAMSVCLDKFKNKGSLGSTSVSRNDQVPSTLPNFKTASGLEILKWLDSSDSKHGCVKQLQKFKAARERASRELIRKLEKQEVVCSVHTHTIKIS